VPTAVAGGVHIKLKEFEEPEPSTAPLLTLLVEPAVNVPPSVFKLLARRAFSWNPQVLKFESLTVTVTGIAAPPGV
jgi:hypothetical protein